MQLFCIIFSCLLIFYQASCCLTIQDFTVPERILTDRCFVVRELCTKYYTRSVNLKVTEFVIVLDKNKAIKCNVT
jgi:hypothetical protein